MKKKNLNNKYKFHRKERVHFESKEIDGMDDTKFKNTEEMGFEVFNF